MAESAGCLHATLSKHAAHGGDDCLGDRDSNRTTDKPRISLNGLWFANRLEKLT